MPPAVGGLGGCRATREGSASSTPNHAKMRPRHQAGAFAGQLTIGSAASNASNLMSSAAAQRVPVRAKRIGAGPRLDQLEIGKEHPHLIGSDAFREKTTAALWLPAEGIEQVRRARSCHPAKPARIRRLGRFRPRVEAT